MSAEGGRAISSGPLGAREVAEAEARGGAEMLFAAAEKFLFGRNGVEEDLAKGAELLKAAGHGGNVEAQNMLGDLYCSARMGFSEDDAKAVKWYRRAADQGDTEGQWRLGDCYLNGIGVDEDEVEAARLYRLSAEQGYAAGQSQLGFCYEYGVGVDQDFEETVKWYRLAADQGLAIAQNNLGNCYEDGKGVEQNYEKAAHFYQLAVDQDQNSAQRNLGLLYSEGNGVQRNCDTALSLLRRSGSSDEYLTDTIAEIEKGARELLEKRSDAQRTMIEAGESVFGQAQDGTGDFALHVAARTLQAETVALFFDHPSFDDLVLRANSAGEFPRDVVNERHPANACTREARALRSILSVSRRTRAASILWCFEVLRDIAPERLMACVPRDIVREIVQRILPPVAPGSLYCGVMTLMNSPGAWPRPCLAFAPPVVFQPTTPADVLALQQQQQHRPPQHRVTPSAVHQESQLVPGKGSKRTLDDTCARDGEATLKTELPESESEADGGSEPDSKRSRRR